MVVLRGLIARIGRSGCEVLVGWVNLDRMGQVDWLEKDPEQMRVEEAAAAAEELVPSGVHAGNLLDGCRVRNTST